jgi:triacylglycerol esterase/lipase EstA (alpha/beta hydrolase family)
VIATLQRLIVVVLIACLSAAIWYSISVGHWASVVAFVLLVAGVYASVLGVEFWLLHRSYPAGSAARPSSRDLVIAWMTELLISPRVFLWRQPFRASAVRDWAVDADARTGVVLVHGFVCNRGFWNPWMRGLRNLGIPFVAVTLEPPFNSIDAYPVAVDAAVRSLEAATGRTPVLVGHSMGGLALRAWRARFLPTSRGVRIVTIGSPHRGTWLARHARTRNGREMRVGSPWLHELAHAESSADYSGFLCFWSDCDNIVFPTDSATLPGADNRKVRATPHVALAFHPDVFDAVVRIVGQANADA